MQSHKICTSGRKFEEMWNKRRTVAFITYLSCVTGRLNTLDHVYNVLYT